MSKLIASKKADQYMLRFPDGLRTQIAERAKTNGRSMNTEIVDAIERYLSVNRLAQLEERIAKLEREAK